MHHALILLSGIAATAGAIAMYTSARFSAIVARHSFALEPIVDLSAKSQSDEAPMYEILRRGSKSQSQMAWRAWYRFLCGAASDLLETNSVNILCINMDARHLLDRRIVSHLQQLGHFGARVVVEWTEFQDTEERIEKAAEVLLGLREEHGFLISIDDVGEGQDGFGRIALTKPDIVKISGKALHRARDDKTSESLLKSIVHACQGANRKVVVEWIETPNDERLSKRIGADYGQGYLYMDAFHFSASEDPSFSRIPPPKHKQKAL